MECISWLNQLNNIITPNRDIFSKIIDKSIPKNYGVRGTSPDPKYFTSLINL